MPRFAQHTRLIAVPPESTRLDLAGGKGLN